MDPVKGAGEEMMGEVARPEGEKGVGLLGVLLTLGMLFVVIWAIARIVPIYFEYWAISNVFQEQVRKANLYEGPQELKTVVLEELKFQELDRLQARDLKIKQLPSGQYRVSAEYQEVVPVTDRVRILFTFRPEAKGG